MTRIWPLLAVWAAVTAVVIAAAPPGAAAPYVDGAPPGFSGGNGEQGCDACHFEFDVNVKPGALTITGVPDRFVPGERYTVEVTLARPGMKLAGFQLTARFEDGKPAGSLAPGSGEADRVKVESQSGVEYANQRRAGATPAPDIARWTVLWTAPRAGGPITFHASANAANGDEATAGDYTYTAATRSRPE